MNYTKGPWKILRSHSGQTWFVVFKTLESKQRSEIVKVYKGPSLVKSGEQEETALASIDPMILNYSQNKEQNEVEAVANAHLIAAAPEMYEALLRIQNEWSSLIQGPLKGICTNIGAECLQAINKAEGK